MRAERRQDRRAGEVVRKRPSTGATRVEALRQSLAALAWKRADPTCTPDEVRAIEAERDALLEHYALQAQAVRALEARQGMVVGLEQTTRRERDEARALLKAARAELADVAGRLAKVEARVVELEARAVELGSGWTQAELDHGLALRAADEALDAERGDHASTLKALENVRAEQRTERKSIAAREGLVDRRIETARAVAEREADRRVEAARAAAEREVEKAAKAAAGLTQRAVDAEALVLKLQADAKKVAAEHKKTLQQIEIEAVNRERRAAAEARKLGRQEADGAELAEARRTVRAEQTARAEAERALAELKAAKPAPVVTRAQAAPRQALIDLLKTGPSSIRRHGARLETWAAGGAGPALEAARAMAAALEGGEVTGEARLKALTGLAGLLGGV